MFCQSADCVEQTEDPQNACQSADCTILIAQTVEPQVLLQQPQSFPRCIKWTKNKEEMSTTKQKLIYNIIILELLIKKELLKTNDEEKSKINKSFVTC